MAAEDSPGDPVDRKEEAEFTSEEAPGPRARWRRSMGSGGRSISVVGFDLDSMRARMKRLFRRRK